MIAAVHRLDLLTMPHAVDPEQSRLRVEAGADALVAHMRLTTRRTIGARSVRTHDDCDCELAATAVAKSAWPDFMVL